MLLDEIELIGKSAPIGVQIRAVCPFCKQRKNSKEETLTVLREEGVIKYMCFSASCNKRGYIGDVSSVGKRGTSKEFTPKHWHGDVTALTEKAINYLQDRCGLYGEVLRVNRIKSTEVGGEPYLHINIIDYNFKVIADYLKNIGVITKHTPKNFLYVKENRPLLYFPKGVDRYDPPPNKLLVVEDPLSSIKVKQVCPVAALLGTNMNETDLLSIKNSGFKEVLLWLDTDATDKAYKIASDLRHILPITVIPNTSNVDPKEMPITLIRRSIFPYLDSGWKY